MQEAIRRNQTAMVQWFLQHLPPLKKEDIVDAMYWAAVAVYWDEKAREINPDIILALMQKGASIEDKLGSPPTITGLFFNCQF